MRLRRQRNQVAADRLLRRAVAVDRCGVDPVDAGRDCAGERGMPGRLIRVDQNAAGDATAERELRDLQPGASEQIFAHEADRGRRHYTELSARSLKRWILPVAVLGSSVRNSIQRGYL